ncbi:hypothetical protein SAMN05421780_11025 [Flexibacter flexilis DSM 6793]|uniref:Uncharacterized protein n=1 Tax=Flexibacter flexilis DSM 6793 TaxID=927664 RepID=A0A1I1M5A2_9BACT|nr:hypothetical protein [Flexibacter flexilis]SFC80216.1 hypothetical protein SAMN05421780_11025 [Flexibacter flexilis DSM 6793]
MKTQDKGDNSQKLKNKKLSVLELAEKHIPKGRYTGLGAMVLKPYERAKTGKRK